jgi:hypothetical protein
MHTTPDNHVENTFVADGGEPTAEEARLMAEGLPDEGDGDPESVEAARVAREAAEATAAAAAKAASDATAADAAAQAAAAAAAAAPAAAAPAPVVDVGTEPVAPTARDFEAERAALRAKYDEGGMNAIDLADARDALMREETAYMIAADAHARDLAAYEARVQAASAARVNDWNVTASQWEAAHQDFLSNPMRHADMQRALALEAQGARDTGETLTHAQLLDRAYNPAATYSSYTPPAGAPDPVRAALDARKPGAGTRTLGDVPAAGAQVDPGGDAFGRLDALPITDLEEAVQNMTPAQEEAYLRASPGSNSRGRVTADSEET